MENGKRKTGAVNRSPFIVGHTDLRSGGAGMRSDGEGL